MRALLDAKCDPDAANKHGATPLYAAIQNNHPESAKLLLSRGADVNADTGDHNSMVHLAVYNGEEEMVKLLLQYDPVFSSGKDDKKKSNKKSKSHVHPVSVAVFLGEFGILHALVTHLVKNGIGLSYRPIAI